MGGFLISDLRINCKSYLSGNTFRLFFISLVSLLLRYLTIAVTGWVVYYFVSNGYGFLYMVIPATFTVGGVFLISKIRCGEQYAYILQSLGQKGKFSHLFFTPSGIKTVDITLMYLKINLLKFAWFIYFHIPVAFCAFCTYFFYTRANIENTVLIIFMTGTVAMFFLCFTVWRCSVMRYSGAVALFLTGEYSINQAIKHSLQATDGILGEGVLLECSLVGWVLSCIAILPVVYVVPYVKTCKAVFSLQSSQKALLTEYVQ